MFLLIFFHQFFRRISQLCDHLISPNSCKIYWCFDKIFQYWHPGITRGIFYIHYWAIVRFHTAWRGLIFLEAKFMQISNTFQDGKGLLCHTCFLCASRTSVLDSWTFIFQKTKQNRLEDSWNASSTQLLAENWRGKWLNLTRGSFKKLKNISSCVINVNCAFMCVYLVKGFVRLCAFI